MDVGAPSHNACKTATPSAKPDDLSSNPQDLHDREPTSTSCLLACAHTIKCNKNYLVFVCFMSVLHTYQSVCEEVRRQHESWFSLFHHLSPEDGTQVAKAGSRY